MVVMKYVIAMVMMALVPEDIASKLLPISH